MMDDGQGAPAAFMNAMSAELAESLADVDPAQLRGLVELIVSGKRVFAAGAGQSALMMKTLAMMLMQAGFTAHVVGDVTTPSIRAGDALIAASYSGTTKSTSLYVAQAKDRGASVGLLTASPDSPMAGLADALVVVRSASDKSSGKPSVLHEGDGFVQALMMLARGIARFAGERIGATEEVTLRNHANIE